MRVAVAQFATSLDTQENLATCIRMINETAVCKPSLIVLPEYCNSQPFYVDHNYVDHNQAWDEALSIDGLFLQSIAAQAKKHHCSIVINVTLRRDLSREHKNGAIKSNISVTSCLFSPHGKLIHQVDKQTLTEYEHDFFISACYLTENVSGVVTTSFGKLGFLSGNDDMRFEISRDLSLGGAQLLCHSLSSFALDQCSFHGPARACENKVFLASANKIGSLKSPELIDQEKGVGQSQIVSPDGKVLAKMTKDEEGFVFTDIEFPNLAGSCVNKKTRPDGTDLIKQRRPELYQELTSSIKKTRQHEEVNNVPITANVAIFATYKSNEEAIDDVCHYIENNLSDIIQLPELFFVENKVITNNAQHLSQVAYLSEQLINQVSAVLRPCQYVCTSLVIEGKHQAVIISKQGLFATQQQLHFCQRYQWTAIGNDINIIQLPLEQGNITVAMLTGDDANIPDIVKILALKGIHLLLVPFDIQEPCEVEYSLLARAVENRICIVAATREKSFSHNFITEDDNKNTHTKNKVKSHKSTGLIINLITDFALLPQWKPRKFDGYINRPLVKYQYGKITKAVIHPIAACNKLIMPLE